VASTHTDSGLEHLGAMSTHRKFLLVTLMKYTMFKHNRNDYTGTFVCNMDSCEFSTWEKLTALIVKQQVVVAYVSPAQAFATGIKIFNWQKLSLIACSFPSEGLDHLIYMGIKGQSYGIPKWARLCPWSKKTCCVEKAQN